jgi:hypothetical protein
LIPVKHRLLDKFLECHEGQQLQEVGTKATDPRSKFAKDLALMRAATEPEGYGMANMIIDK